MPKCSKYHAKWHVLVPNWYKIRGKWCQKRSRKKVQQTQKETKSIPPFHGSMAWTPAEHRWANKTRLHREALHVKVLECTDYEDEGPHVSAKFSGCNRSLVLLRSHCKAEGATWSPTPRSSSTIAPWGSWSPGKKRRQRRRKWRSWRFYKNEGDGWKRRGLNFPLCPRRFSICGSCPSQSYEVVTF